MRTIDSTEEMLACSEVIREVSHLLIDADEQTEFALRQMWAAGRDWARRERAEIAADERNQRSERRGYPWD